MTSGSTHSLFCGRWWRPGMLPGLNVLAGRVAGSRTLDWKGLAPGYPKGLLQGSSVARAVPGVSLSPSPAPGTGWVGGRAEYPYVRGVGIFRSCQRCPGSGPIPTVPHPCGLMASFLFSRGRQCGHHWVGLAARPRGAQAALPWQRQMWAKKSGYQTLPIFPPAGPALAPASEPCLAVLCSIACTLHPPAGNGGPGRA